MTWHSDKPKVPCVSCGEIGNHDWMYDAGLVGPEKYVCGKCKIEIGKAIRPIPSVLIPTDEMQIIKE